MVSAKGGGLEGGYFENRWTPPCLPWTGGSGLRAAAGGATDSGKLPAFAEEGSLGGTAAGSRPASFRG